MTDAAYGKDRPRQHVSRAHEVLGRDRCSVPRCGAREACRQQERRDGQCRDGVHIAAGCAAWPARRATASIVARRCAARAAGKDEILREIFHVSEEEHRRIVATESALLTDDVLRKEIRARLLSLDGDPYYNKVRGATGGDLGGRQCPRS